ncbi:unnamed protein product [Ceutorhynchus assimilis]|uniref:Probable oligoribonuclease n=1 Tax=Ceutorhynchus assimilis TaxID=467358 RepID=A0A9N9MQT7_9CUCU|nr:unnamed protein product [Ceutorhynchus assimilis]
MFHKVIKQGFCVGNKLFQMGLHKSNSCNSTVDGLAIAAGKHLDFEMDRLIWIDMEMTGLNVDQDKIMEIACLVTDSNLNIIAEGPDLIIKQPKDILDNMNEWCIKQHRKTGLTEASLKSQTTLEEAENIILDFLKNHVTSNTCPLAGNSVYMDRFFLIKHMPKLNGYLHYRIVDVSTIKEICRRWNTSVFKGLPKKEFEHRALADIRESVAELKYYRENFFKVAQ